MKPDAADLVEVFSSIQGEGVYIGQRQIFIRFAGCNLSCAYCDTGKDTVPPSCRMELTPGRRDFHELANPVPMARVVDLLERWLRGWPTVHHSISLTGGEPLLHDRLLRQWLPRLHTLFPVHLETNGVLHAPLAGIIREVDYISMDIKLPSSSGGNGLWDEHRAFLATAAETEVSVKIVVSGSTGPGEIQRAAGLVADIDPDIPVIIQPETAGDLALNISPAALLELQEIASSIVNDVRIIPQTHRFIGLL